MSTLRFLRTFMAVARCGSFAEAAEHVSLTQAAVSFQMRALEETLNRRLFERQGRISVLTAAGREILPEAQALLDQFDRLCAPKADAEELAGAVALGAIVSCMAPLSKGVSKLKTRYPRLDVRLSTGKSGELAEQVEAEDLDAAIIVEPARMPAGLRWIPLCEEPLILLAPVSAAARSPQDALARYPFLRFDRKEYTGRLVDRALKQLHCPVDEFLELNSIDSLVELVRQEVGVALLPLLANSDWLKDPSLHVLYLPKSMHAAVRRIGLVMRTDYARPKFAEEFYVTCTRMFDSVKDS